MLSLGPKSIEADWNFTWTHNSQLVWQWRHLLSHCASQKLAVIKLQNHHPKLLALSHLLLMNSTLCPGSFRVGQLVNFLLETLGGTMWLSRSGHWVCNKKISGSNTVTSRVISMSGLLARPLTPGHSWDMLTPLSEIYTALDSSVC